MIVRWEEDWSQCLKDGDGGLATVFVGWGRRIGYSDCNEG